MPKCLICREEKDKSNMKPKFIEDWVCGDCLLKYGDDIRVCTCGAPLIGEDKDEIECEECREKYSVDHTEEDDKLHEI